MKIAWADAAQLTRLPRFGLEKVIGLRDAFFQPFRMGPADDVFSVVSLRDCPNLYIHGTHAA